MGLWKESDPSPEGDQEIESIKWNEYKQGFETRSWAREQAPRAPRTNQVITMTFHDFDHFSARPVHPAVMETMTTYFTQKYGNPSSVHARGRDANAALERAREYIKTELGANDGSLVFTSGATEANNLAILGLAAKYLKKGTQGKTRLITTQLEHVSVYNTFQYLEKQGFQVDYLPLDEQGVVKLAALEKAITEDTALVSLMYASQEVGSIQPVSEVAKIAADHGAVFHSDASAAFGRLPINVKDEGISLMTVASNYLYGPGGIGALYIENGRYLEPLFRGGPQEFRKRPGTEVLPLIMGFRKALEVTLGDREKENARLRALQQRLIKGLTQVPASHLNGHPTNRLPDNVNVRFSYIEGEAMLLHLENMGFLGATGSACTSDSLQASRVLTSMGIPHEEAHGSLQVTLGRDSTEEAADELVELLPPIVEQLRMMSPLTPDDFFD